MRRLLSGCLCTVAAAAVFTSTAAASPGALYGIQDDAWLAHGPGTLAHRLDLLQRLGVDVVRFSLHWDQVAPRRPARALSAGDPAYRWAVSDAVLRGLRARGIQPLVTLFGTPGWANGRRGPNVVPSSRAAFGDFAYAAARRYPFVRRWTIWNEPNQRLMFASASPKLYVTRLLNPAYTSIHRANPRAVVAGGMTASRGNTGGVAPILWIKRMRAAGARLDAYAHHPYPARPSVETPFRGGCGTCGTITMANLPRLLAQVRKSFGAKPVWLTEYGYQTNPPDRQLGVSQALQARYIGEGALRVYQQPQVTLLVHFLVKDEPELDRWQSGLYDVGGSPKLAASAFPFPLAQVTRSGSRVVLWGQIRPRRGAQSYRLQLRAGRSWRWLGSTARTNALGFFSRTVAAPRAALVRIWSPRDRAYGAPVLIR